VITLVGIVEYAVTQVIELNITARELVYPFSTANCHVRLNVIDVYVVLQPLIFDVFPFFFSFFSLCFCCYCASDSVLKTHHLRDIMPSKTYSRAPLALHHDATLYRYTNEDAPVFELPTGDHPPDTFTPSVVGGASARYDITVAQGLPSGTAVLRVVANDTEDFNNGTFPSLRLATSSPPSLGDWLAFNASEGMFYVTEVAPMWRNYQVNRDVVVEAEDSGGLVTNATVSISTAGDFVAGTMLNTYTPTGGGTLGVARFGPSMLDTTALFSARAPPPPPPPASVQAILACADGGLTFDNRACRVALQTRATETGVLLSGHAVSVFLDPETLLANDLVAASIPQTIGPLNCTTNAQVCDAWPLLGPNRRTDRPTPTPCPTQQITPSNLLARVC
jgi:hypothetical protein